MTLDLRGGLCICGNYGCLETCFSSRAIESAYAAHLHRASPTRCRSTMPVAAQHGGDLSRCRRRRPERPSRVGSRFRIAGRHPGKRPAHLRSRSADSGRQHRRGRSTVAGSDPGQKSSSRTSVLLGRESSHRVSEHGRLWRSCRRRRAWSSLQQRLAGQSERRPAGQERR